MDVRRALPFLLLVICTINAFSIHNGRGGPNNVRRVRRISEYLVPPLPPSRFHPPGRIPRLAKYQSYEPGYLMRFVNWINPFSPLWSKPSPPLPPPQAHQSEATYNRPSITDYETPPPPSPINDNSGYPAPTKTKNCNPCNKEPWVPIQQTEPSHVADGAPYEPPPLPVESSSNGGYPPRNPEASYDAHRAASQEIKIPDFSYAPLLPGQNSPIISPLPNPLLYPGVMPPLFNAEEFSKPLQVASESTESFPDVTGSASNDGPVYPGVVSQKPVYHPYINRLSSSSDEVTKGNINPTFDEQGLEGAPTDPFDSVNYQSVSDGSSGIGDTIFIEESPLIDFTHKNESRTQSSSIPQTSNVFVGFENVETVAPDDEIFETRQDFASTESYSSTDYADPVVKESKINNSTVQKQDIPPSDKVESLWSNIFPTISNGTEPIRNNLLKPDDDITEEILHDNINVNLNGMSGQHDRKRNPQVQLIIPYTSQYTPLPFQPSHERKTSDTGVFNRDGYVPEESKNRYSIVVTPPSPVFSRPQPIFEDTTRKPIDTAASNSIDLQKFIKNIDNWTIQSYSTPAVSTASPSKTIPKEYFTTPESVSRVADFYNNNVKTFTLGGFTFNDEEYKGSASHRKEGRQVQIIKTENSTESPINASTTSEKDMWRGFPVGISSVNKERVYIVTPLPLTTPRSNPDIRKQKVLEKAESNTEESKKTSQTDMKETKKSDKFELIEKAYQVLPQAVNNLAVASTGPESVPLWGIMEHEVLPVGKTYAKYLDAACCIQQSQKGDVPGDDASSVKNAQDDYLCPCR